MGPRDVAKATSVSPDTLRHYERRGLLPNVSRTAAGYRRYTTATVDRVLLIQRALVVGFSLDELKQVLTMRDQGGAPCRSVRTLVGRRLDGLERRIGELLALRDELRVLLAQWDGKLANTAPGQRVYLLDSLGSTVTIERARSTRAHRPPAADVRAIHGPAGRRSAAPKA
jgi:DNA-binding transcriptional MerR regulator